MEKQQDNCKRCALHFRLHLAGFTLVEVITIIAIVGILSAIAIPSFMAMVPNIRLKADAQELYASIQKAKLEAVKRNTCMGIKFNTVVYPAVGGSYIYFVDDGVGGGVACNGIQDGAENFVSVTNVNKYISLVSASNIGGPGSICFNPGSVVCGSQSGNIQLRNQSRWYRATVLAAGGVRIEMSPNGVNWSN